MSSTPYDLQQIKAFVFDIDGVISRSTTPLDEEGNPLRTVNVKDGYALQFAVKRGFPVGVITGGYTPNMALRMAHLGVVDYYQQSRNKVRDLTSFMEKYHLAPEEVLYVGDDIPDLEVMQLVGLSVAPRDASPEILSVARYIAHATGGDGVAREVIEQTLRAQGVWATEGVGLAW